MDALEVIRLWRALPAEEKARRRWASIPRHVAQSMAFEGEPVDLAMLEAEHARRSMPTTELNPIPPICTFSSRNSWQSKEET